MDTHDAFRELAALRLYGELDPAELERLERHLAQCEACSALVLELESGLGRLALTAADGDLPKDWSRRLEAAIVAPRPLPALTLSNLRVAAASFLFGALVAWTLATGHAERSGSTGERSAPDSPARTAFERSTPPPRARETASLPPLAELYLRR